MRSWRNPKGERIAGGSTGIVERISEDRVSKAPWTGREHKWCLLELDFEAKIYGILGSHPRFIDFFGRDTDGALILEYMRQGTVRDYLQSHNEISQAQRFQWALQATEGLSILHSKAIIHCDFSPRNLMLSEDLQIKVADFGGASLNRSSTLAMGSVRFQHPSGSPQRPAAFIDIFSLGSTIYEIITGNIPYEDVSTDGVKQLYALSQFPDLTGVLVSGVIRRCWMLEFKGVADAYELLSKTDTSALSP